MKKYLQYNTPHFRETPSDVGINHPHRQVPETRQNGPAGAMVLDLSGRPNVNPVVMVADQKGANEQEAALDLSKYGKQESQEEALDLSRPSANRPERPGSQSYPQTHPVIQSHHSIHTPPATRHSKSPAGQQYSLLQAALNSSQPNAGLHTVFDRICQSTAAMLEQRAMIFSTAGMPVTDYGRTIKPFSSLSSRPLGITMPHMSHSSGAVIQGMHKPIAITTPQPHNSSVNTKSQSVSDATVSVTDASHSISSTSNQGYSVSQSNYTSGHSSQIGRQLNSSKVGNADSHKYSPESLKDPTAVERYLIQPPKGLNHFVGNVNLIPTEALTGFSCDQCSKSFKTKAALKLHTTVHKTAEERQYACTVCSRRFLHRHHLVVHQRKHSGEKPFKCTACSKTFMAIFLLHKHLRKHARETGLVAQISSEQLKQLHDKKLLQHSSTQSVPSLNTEKPTSDSNSVIVLDDDEDDVNATVEIKVNEAEGKLNRKRYERHKNQSILDMIEKDPNMILEKIKADLIKSQSGSVDADEVKNVMIEEKDELTSNSKLENEQTEENNTEISLENTTSNTDRTDSENCDKQKFQEDTTDYFIKSEDVDNTYNYIIKESNDESNIELNTEKDIIKQEVHDMENEGSKEENLNNFPEYGSDDEVELDFTTGELKVVGKLNLNDEKLNEVKIENDITDKEKENLDNKERTGKTEVEETHEQCFDDKGRMKETVVTETNGDSIEMEETSDKQDTEMTKDTESVLILRNVEYNKELEKWEKVKADFEKSAERDMPAEKNYEKFYKKKSDCGSGNIFEKIIEMKDGLRISEESTIQDKTFKDGKNKVDKDVEAILGVIKQKLCEDEESLDIVSKKPRFDESYGNKSGVPLNVIAQNKNSGTELHGVARKHARHRKGKKKGKKVKCEVCSRSFHSEHYLVLHMAVHKRNPMLQSLKKAKDYQMKAMGFLNKTNVTCEICKKVFKFQKSLNSHMRVHSEKMIQTKLYRKAFRDFMAEAAPHSSRTASTDKEKSHTQNGESESQMRRYSAGEQLHDRDKTVSAASVKRVSCDIENTNVLKEEQYDDPPIKVIIGEDNIKRYLCHACDNTYTTRQKLRMHALIHKDNCFLCDVCGKSFFRHITLEKHISTHRLPRPHICEVCKKTFIHRSSLMRHKVVHEKPTIPSIKQQVADISFEMKMLDTYTMLRHERMQKLQTQKVVDTSKMDPVSVKTVDKYDPLDLTVRIKNEDLGLPPVLSPVSAGVPNVTHASSWNLSPPLITHETSSDIGEKTPEKSDMNKYNEIENRTANSESMRSPEVIENHKRRTESTCSESDTVAVEGHQVVQKRSRKTRVYQTSCRVCKEVFPNVMLLKSHMLVHNTVETHLYECHICRHRFTQSCSLLRHLKTSCQENRMKCVPCGRTFHRRNTFDQHMRLHQGGPPNLDGSFYDKRPDEAEVIEERESDIENNNLSKLEGAVINQDSNIDPLRLELINIIEKETSNNLTVIKQDGIDSDSDARTYLYSEGEVHSRYNSDFSDNDWSPPQSPKKPPVPQDLSVTSGNMTLNLLSAVCSDIRNAEKEQELKRKELEEKQKELETIEILANLKRGAMQKSINSTATVSNVYQVSSSFNLNCDKATIPSSTQLETFGSPELDNTQLKSNLHDQIVYSQHVRDGNKLNPHHKFGNSDKSQDNGSSLFPHEQKPSTSCTTHLSQNLPSVIEGNSSSTSEPKIPTVVLEVAAEAERKRRQRVESTWQEKPFSALTMGSPNSAVSGPHSVSSIPPSSAWSPHSVSSIPHSVASGPHSAPVVSPSSSHLSPFIPHSSARGPRLSVSSPHQSASSSFTAPVAQNISGRCSQSASSTLPPGNDVHSSRETSMHQEMSQMKMHYPAIQERLSLLMKAQVSTSVPGSSQNASAQSPKAVDKASTFSSTTPQAVHTTTPSVRHFTNSNSDAPQDLSLKKISQEPLSAHSSPSSRSFYSRSLSTDMPRTSHIESKRSETLRTFPADMPLPLTKEKKSESLKSLPSERARHLSVENKSDIPRSDSSRSLPADEPRSFNNEPKRSESVPAQQPLVPMLQCDLCSRVLYNKTDLHLHMMEHGRSAGALYKMLHSNKSLPEQNRLSIDSPIDFTKAGPGQGFGHSSKEYKVTPPHSLDLSSKKSDNELKAFNLSASQTPENSPGAQSKHFMLSAHKEKLSPVSSSDQSDSLPSPSTPSGSSQSAASLDALRQELRLKIYARRRSQGLDDLKVEFKPPEPTEMTESEKLKLMYRRECNRQAAQRSRMRKKDLVDSLLEKLSEMPNVSQKEKKADP